MRFLSFKYLYLNLFIVPFGGFGQSPIDYSNNLNWAALPNQMPEMLAIHCIDTLLWSKADVFYVYPTLNTKNSDKRWNVPIDDIEQRNKVQEIALPYQASAFVEAGRFYCPYYQSAHIRAYDGDDLRGEEALGLAYQDVRAAFLYYLEHYNQGRPIIIASHSQGSTHCGRLLQEFFDGKTLQNQLIAAYLPGIGILASDLKEIPLLTYPEQTGGYLTWNTFKKHIDQNTYVKWYKGREVINPVTWNTETYAEKKRHKGLLYYDNRIYSQLFATHMIDGAIWIERPKGKFFLMSLWMRNYHIGDINLFWQDIHDNVKLRTELFHENK